MSIILIYLISGTIGYVHWFFGVLASGIIINILRFLKPSFDISDSICENSGFIGAMQTVHNFLIKSKEATVIGRFFSTLMSSIFCIVICCFSLNNYSYYSESNFYFRSFHCYF